jgi:hypothetical protein
MIKTIIGAKDKLLRMKEKTYKYCVISVDGNTIGPALIDDILDSIQYCRSPRGIIKQFIFHGYEYVVDDGIDINPLPDEKFMEMYMPSPGKKKHWTEELTSEYLCKTAEEIAREEEKFANTRMDGSGLTKNISEEVSDFVSKAKRTLDGIERKVDRMTEYKPKAKDEPKKKQGLLSRIKSWIKGDVSYKK